MSAPTSLFDDSLWPLLRMKLVGAASPQQFKAFLEKRTSYLLLPERHIALLDMTEASPEAALEQRQPYLEWLKAHEARLRESVLGTAFIVTSPVIQLTLSIVLYSKPMPTPYLLTPHLGTALDWAVQRFEEAKLPAVARRVRDHFGMPASARAG